jgi:N-acetylglucosaminyldiphosphoundecaprenol N-acetyl-beta-D-mannosaminyltransferase
MHKVLSDNLSNNDKNLTTYLNLHSYRLARKNKEVFKNFNILIDGIIFVWILKLFGFVKVKRNSFDMTSMAPKVFDKAINKKQSIYFVGAKPNVIDDSVSNIRAEFLGLNICGFRHGYFGSKEEYKVVIEEIKELKVNIVVCGMGTPLQEQFLIDLKNCGWDGKGYTCGGFLHQTANKIQYYPYLIDKYNLRGFYRMYDEPKLIKRYLISYPIALFLYVFDSLQYNLNKTLGKVDEEEIVEKEEEEKIKVTVEPTEKQMKELEEV